MNIYFSIVIVTHNRYVKLKRCLEQLNNQNYSKKLFEVIVINDGSTDKTKTLKNTDGDGKLKLNVVHFNTNQGISVARNRGFSFSQYDKIIFLDDDLIFDEDLVANFANTWKKKSDGAIVGGYVIAKKTKESYFLSMLRANNSMWILGEIFLGKKKRFLKYPEIIPGACISVSKKKIKDIRFDPSLVRNYSFIRVCGEDFDFFVNLYNLKKKIYYNPKIKVINDYEIFRLSYFYLFKRYFRAGIEVFFIDKKHVLTANHKKLYNYINIYESRTERLLKVCGYYGFRESYFAILRETCKSFFAIGYFIIGPLLYPQKKQYF